MRGGKRGVSIHTYTHTYTREIKTAVFCGCWFPEKAVVSPSPYPTNSLPIASPNVKMCPHRRGQTPKNPNRPRLPPIRLPGARQSRRRQQNRRLAPARGNRRRRRRSPPARRGQVQVPPLLPFPPARRRKRKRAKGVPGMQPPCASSTWR